MLRGFLTVSLVSCSLLTFVSQILLAPTHATSSASTSPFSSESEQCAMPPVPVSPIAPPVVRMPALFVSHGGGPMPVLGDPFHAGITKFFKSVRNLLPAKPTAIVSVTGHWETSVPTVCTSPAPSMLYDYGGFPPESYSLQYPAPGHPHLAERIAGMLQSAGIKAAKDSRRGFDHGTFIPLMLMFPEADIPVVQMSVLSSQDPKAHIELGHALAPLREEGVFILGSGSSIHNMGVLMRAWGERASKEDIEKSKAFDDWLHETCVELEGEAREKALIDWERAAPHGRFSHPREEHLTPLHVIAGAGGSSAKGNHCMKAMFGKLPMSGFMFD